MASSKTSQGEDKWGKHGMQMCLMRLERKQLLMQYTILLLRLIAQKSVFLPEAAPNKQG